MPLTPWMTWRRTVRQHRHYCHVPTEQDYPAAAAVVVVVVVECLILPVAVEMKWNAAATVHHLHATAAAAMRWWPSCLAVTAARAQYQSLPLRNACPHARGARQHAAHHHHHRFLKRHLLLSC